MIDVVAERTTLGGLARYLDDQAVTEVMVNAGHDVWVERAGRIERVGSMTTAVLLGAIEQMLAPIGRRLDRLSPTVDARLPDGSRVCAAIPPVAVDGPCLTIRRFNATALPLNAFAGSDVVEVLHSIVEARSNVLVTGPTSSGKTSLLNALAAKVPTSERIVTMEDTAELRIAHPHVVRLETRPATAEGLGAVSLGDLLRLALRLRPDRLVVGEIRGSEALEMLQAMNTGHDGSLATLHANSATDALHRLSTLVLGGAPAWPPSVAEGLIGAALDVVVHLRRDADGRRRVENVSALGAGMTLLPIVEHGGVLPGRAPRGRRR